MKIAYDSKEQIDYLYTIINLLPHTVFWKDKYSRFLGCNQAFADLAGLESPSDIVGKADHDLPWSKSESKLYVEADKEIMATGKAMLNIEEKQTLKNGKKITLLTSKVPLYFSGELNGILGIYTDISDRKKMEIALKKMKEKAEAANEAKTVFIANMSHDIRTPLTSIIGLADILANRLQTSEDFNDVKLIAQSAEQLLVLLNGILDVASMEHTVEEDLKKDSFSLLEFSQSLKMLFLPAIELKGLTFNLDIDASISNPIVSDRVKLQRILLNLITNAIKFTVKGIVTLRIKKLSESKDTVELEFTVSDTGLGIPPEKLSQIFDQFFRVNPMHQASGYGVGLSIVKKFVSLLGGEIQVHSKLEEGTTFFFTLLMPVDKEKSAKQAIPYSVMLDKGEKEAEKKKIDLELIAANIPKGFQDVVRRTRANERSVLDSHEHVSTDVQQHHILKSEGYTSEMATSDSDMDLTNQHSGKKSVLLIEDNPIALKVGRTLLESEGYKVYALTNSLEALHLAKTSDFDLIITDVGLAEITGKEFAMLYRYWEKITKNKRPIPMIALTAQINAQFEQECLVLGMDEVWSKPLSKEKLATLAHYFTDTTVLSSESLNSDKNGDELDRADVRTPAELFDIKGYPIFDDKVSLYNLGSDEYLQKEVLKIFKEMLAFEISQLKKAYKKKNWGMFVELVHKLKGSSVYAGAVRLDYACQNFLRYYATGQTEWLDSLYRQLKMTLEECGKALKLEFE
ncbi:MAG: ATP-binding protein [Pseudomonadota bacterium]